MKKGKPKSEEHKRKLSKANKGKPKSEATKQKMSEARRGKPRSEATKRKILCKHCHGSAHNDELIARLGYILRVK